MNVSNMEHKISEATHIKNLSSLENRNRFLVAQGAIAFLIRSMNAAHPVDLTGLTCEAVRQGLRSATGPTIVFHPCDRFKNSFSKTKAVFRLSVPARYGKVMQSFIVMR